MTTKISLRIHSGGQVVYDGEDGSNRPIHRYVGGNSEYVQFREQSAMGEPWHIGGFLMAIMFTVDGMAGQQSRLFYYAPGVTPLRMRELCKQSHLDEICRIRGSEEHPIDVFTMICPHCRPIEGLADDDSPDEQVYYIVENVSDDD